MAARKESGAPGEGGGLREPAVDFVGDARVDRSKVEKTGKSVVMTRAKLKQSGGSLIFTVPAAARRAMQLNAGDEVDVTVEDGRLILEAVAPAPPMLRVRRPKYSIEELVEGYNADAPLSDEEQTWMEAPAVGREIW